MNRLVVDEVDDAVGLSALSSEWAALFESVPRASPFLSPDWALTWQATLGNGSQPRVLCARDDGQLVGLLALSEKTHGRFGKAVRRLVFLGEETVAADGLDILARPELEREVAAALLSRLASDEAIDVLDLEGIPADSPTLQLLAWHFANDGQRRYVLSPHEVCPYLELDGSWDAVLARTRRPHQFGRLLRTLGGPGRFELRTITEPGEVGEALERLLTLHEKRWAVQGGSDAMSRPAVREFHRELVRRLATRGMVRFEELWVDGGCRASYYGFGRGDRYWLYQSGFDSNWAKRSVAFVRLGLSIREATDRGVKFYDFLRGTENYKFDWATGARVTVRVRAISHRRAARFFAARQQLRLAAELAAEAIVPDRSLDLLRRWRRAKQKREITPHPDPPPQGGREIQDLSPQRGREIRDFSPQGGREIQDLSPLRAREIKDLSPQGAREIQLENG
jgi:CelD/BcsL family acetyltransferase involved in cellulose biosynthesis